MVAFIIIIIPNAEKDPTFTVLLKKQKPFLSLFSGDWTTGKGSFDIQTALGIQFAISIVSLAFGFCLASDTAY